MLCCLQAPAHCAVGFGLLFFSVLFFIKIQISAEKICILQGSNTVWKNVDFLFKIFPDCMHCPLIRFFPAILPCVPFSFLPWIFYFTFCGFSLPPCVLSFLNLFILSVFLSSFIPTFLSVCSVVQGQWLSLKKGRWIKMLEHLKII